ncbi:MAG: transcriptional regulator TbsP [Halopenitus sp.]
MVSNLLETDVEDILESAFTGTEGELLVVDPSDETIESIVEAGVDRTDLPEILMLADEDVLKDVMDDFLVASKAADLIDDGSLTIRELPEDADNSLFVSEDRVLALVSTDDRVAALSSEDEEFVDEVFSTYHEAFDEAEDHRLRTPAISHVRETMGEEIGEEARADFDSVLDSMETARGNGDGLDEVTISLLVAAKNDALLYDISKWGEDVGIASKATFSRTKTRLEDLGLIDTEKVPIDVGRPRLRLKLGDERLKDTSPDQLASAAESMLA